MISTGWTDGPRIHFASVSLPPTSYFHIDTDGHNACRVRQCYLSHKISAFAAPSLSTQACLTTVWLPLRIAEVPDQQAGVFASTCRRRCCSHLPAHWRTPINWSFEIAGIAGVLLNIFTFVATREYWMGAYRILQIVVINCKCQNLGRFDSISRIDICKHARVLSLKPYPLILE